MSDNTKQKKAIRARQQSTGETYSTARLHVLRALPEPPAAPPPAVLAPPPPPAGFAPLVALVIDLASSARKHGGEPAAGASAPRVDLRSFLLALSPAQLRKMEVLMYAGRAGEGLRDVAGELTRSTPAETVDLIESKLAVLAGYLRRGLMVAEHEHIDLDAEWGRKNPGRWAHEPGSAYDRAIDGMHAWDARIPPDRDEKRDAELRRAWMKREGVTQAESHACLLRLTELGCSRTAHACVYLPGSDHTTMWLKAGKPHIYVTQPYNLGQERLDEMFRVCRRHGLTLRVDSAPAWHNEMAVLIEVLRA